MDLGDQERQRPERRRIPADVDRAAFGLQLIPGWAGASEAERVAEVTSDERDVTNPDPERTGLKAQGIRALLAEWDPLGVTASDGSSDEYECLVWPLTRLLNREASAEQVASFLSSELAGHFGVDAQTGEPGQFASRLIAWFGNTTG